MKIEKAKEILKEIAEELGGRVRENYSGRGMFGRTCLAIVCDSPKACIAAAAKKRIVGASTDNMGLSYVIYWRSLDTTPVPETAKV